MNYGGQQPGGFGGQPGGYGGGPYGGQQPGNYPQNPNPGHQGGASPEVQQWFNAVDRDRSGKITAKELQAALVNGQGKNFSDQACNLMIGMFDQDKTGTIDINEFQQLYNYINQWLGTFRSYDRDQSGFIEEAELAQAFQQMGFRFSPEFIKFLISKSDMQNHTKISVDQFIVLCVQIQRFTENDSDVDFHPIDSPYGRTFKKRRKTRSDDICFNPENGAHSMERNTRESRIEHQGSQPINRQSHDNEKLKEDMNQLVNENVHLLKENKQLQEDNSRLKDQLRCLCEENERLRREHRDALDLSSWLSSAREIVETLKKKPVIFTKPPKRLSPMVRPMDTQNQILRPSMPHSNGLRNILDPRNSHWSDADMHQANGSFSAAHIKIERADEDQHHDGGQESPYHTPLLNFDQVEFQPSGKESSDMSNNWAPDITVTEPLDDELDRLGREQLLFPEPVEGVCELCPSSRIYVALTAMDNILSKKSHSSVARSCLEAIFKMPYLLSCSVQGNVAKGPYGKPDVQRPSLYRPAVECILKYARFHAEQNSWKVEENTTIKKQMNTRLSELRNIAKYKAQAQAAASEAGDNEHKGYSRYKNIVAALSALPIVAQPALAEMPAESESRTDTRDSSTQGDLSEPT